MPLAQYPRFRARRHCKRRKTPGDRPVIWVKFRLINGKSLRALVFDNPSECGVAEQVFVVGGQSVFDEQLQIAVKQQLRPFENHLDIVYLTNLTMPDLLERMKHLPGHSVVLLTTIAQDAAGTRFKSNESGTGCRCVERASI
jgi:hypothetical protein